MKNRQTSRNEHCVLKLIILQHRTRKMLGKTSSLGCAMHNTQAIVPDDHKISMQLLLYAMLIIECISITFSVTNKHLLVIMTLKW